MNIRLSDSSNNQSLELPVLPEEIEVCTAVSNNTLEVVNLGEIGIIGSRKLRSVTLTSFFPRYYSSYCQYLQIPDPNDAVKLIEKWRDSKKPIRLAITSPDGVSSGLSITMSCMIEEFNYREKGGQPGDIYYDLVLKEYRFIQARIITQDSAKNKVKTETSRPSDRKVPAAYTVKKGDSLYVIAKTYYGNGSRWVEIYSKNKGVIGKDPNLIKPGQVLKL